MRGKLFALLILFLISGQRVFAQDSAKAVVKKREPLHLLSFADPHSPKKASIYSAVLPGLGQIYNNKYWKAPIVYATLGAATYSMFYYRGQMRDYNKEFKAAYAINADTTLDPNKLALRDNARRYRDFSILAMSAIYVLQIVDATVDAHFYEFDINQDLSAKLSPNPSRMVQFAFTF